ncbi:MAG: hypothetical protein JWQ81_7310 [Amycolatopsis sp.]|jgi:hypothetical protein|uniref:hypothetical protein n=1 Tax=Amycolatopsis sp. TaxID=37632 RepID=UPI00262DA46A|nr:hypothetical protein [Amycolatopsis sp.]MCU1686571.1 hypothetical protein [Amycolatopsis sp.]
MAVRRTGLIAAVVLVGALVAGGVLGLVLVSAGGRPAASPPAASDPAPPLSTATSSPAPPAGEGAAAAGQAIAEAITAHDSHRYAGFTCQPQSAAAIDQLQRKWDAAGDVEASMPQPPVVTGDTATVTIHVVGSAGRKDTVFPLYRQGTTWCIPG